MNLELVAWQMSSYCVNNPLSFLIIFTLFYPLMA